MPRIVQLSSDLINKIAAGEVVERPASVVKELVENALDAGATRIDVEMDGGGRDRIRIADDGWGMSREDALLAVERHATSKLRDAEGLFQIASFGFRGEAVPAIASVSRMSLVTREPEALEGTRIEIEGGKVALVESCGAPRGTSFVIRDLFFATPARRKFLKRPETETAHASEALVRLALARPDVAFSLRSNGRQIFQAPATEDPRERIAAAIGKEIFPHLVPVDHRRGTIRVRGFVAGPGFSAATNRAVYTFVNGRFIRDRQLMHAIQRSYEGLLPQGRSPGLVIFVDVPPSEVDVNVHPQKLEVRFADPRGVYDAVLGGLGEALSKAGRASATEGEEVRHHPVARSSQPVFDWQARYRQLGWGSSPAPRPDSPSIREAAALLWPKPGDDGAGAELPSEAVAAPSSFSELRIIGQLGPSFLLCESPTGSLLILGLHAIRERLALDRLRAAAASGDATGQPFLFPVIVDPGAGAARILAEHAPLLIRLGLELEPFGGTNFAIKSVPPLLVGIDYEGLLVELARILGGAAEGREEAEALACLACRSAEREEPLLGEEEARELLLELDGASKGEGPRHDRVVVSELAFEALLRRAF